jgi:phosphonate transport system substrate-binding protein
MAEFELREGRINSEADFRFRYTGSHPATAAMVETGVVDAGAIDETVLQFLISEGKVDGNKIRIFHTSKPYVDYVYVARKDLPEAERNRFARALLALKSGKDDPTLKILRAKTFVMAHDEDYSHMRQIAHKLQMF